MSKQFKTSPSLKEFTPKTEDKPAYTEINKFHPHGGLRPNKYGNFDEDKNESSYKKPNDNKFDNSIKNEDILYKGENGNHEVYEIKFKKNDNLNPGSEDLNDRKLIKFNSDNKKSIE
jgi:hypothetical protein